MLHVPIATASSLAMALALLGCSMQGPIKSDPEPGGLQDAPALETRAARSETPAAHPKTGQVPRIEPAECVTQELVDAGAKRFLFFGQENRDAPNGTVVELQGLGHELPGECRPKLITAFLEDPYAKVDDSCKNDTSMEPWVLE